MKHNFFLRERRAELLHSSEKKTTSNSFCLFVTLSGIIHWYSVRKNILRYMVWSCNIWDLQGVEWFFWVVPFDQNRLSDILMNIATHIFQHNPFSCTPSVTATLLRTLVICLAYLYKHKVYKTQNSIVSSFDPAGLIVLHFVHPDKPWDAK